MTIPWPKIKRQPIKPPETPEARAERLLQSVLGPRYDDMQRSGRLEVEGNSYDYALSRTSMTMLFAKGTGFKAPKFSACIHVSVPSPPADRVVAEYLLLKSDEAKYLEIANLWPAYIGQIGGGGGTVGGARGFAAAAWGAWGGGGGGEIFIRQPPRYAIATPTPRQTTGTQFRQAALQAFADSMEAFYRTTYSHLADWHGAAGLDCRVVHLRGVHTLTLDRVGGGLDLGRIADHIGGHAARLIQHKLRRETGDYIPILGIVRLELVNAGDACEVRTAPIGSYRMSMTYDITTNTYNLLFEVGVLVSPDDSRILNS